eukprot:jgi/Psemu1/2577/gm1.2577_g
MKGATRPTRTNATRFVLATICTTIALCVCEWRTVLSFPISKKAPKTNAAAVLSLSSSALKSTKNIVSNNDDDDDDDDADLSLIGATTTLAPDKRGCANGTTAVEDNHCSNENGNGKENEPKLSCRVLGFYPFPTPPPRGPLGWLLKDTHQAIVITTVVSASAPAPAPASTPSDKEQQQQQQQQQQQRTKKITLLLDFMTKGGASHPVWYDEFVKWNVLLGGNIEGEIRVKVLGTKPKEQDRRNAFAAYAGKENGDCDYDDDDDDGNRIMTTLSRDIPELDRKSSSKMKRLIRFADSYNCEMNLYRSNCRMFAARMEREVQRLNLEREADDQDWSYRYGMINGEDSLLLSV